MTDTPTAETAAFLHHQAASSTEAAVRRTARLALGTVAHQWLDAQPERAAEIGLAQAVLGWHRPDSDGFEVSARAAIASQLHRLPAVDSGDE